jgi:hypothetical protein
LEFLILLCLEIRRTLLSEFANYSDRDVLVWWSHDDVNVMLLIQSDEKLGQGECVSFPTELAGKVTGAGYREFNIAQPWTDEPYASFRNR